MDRDGKRRETVMLIVCAALGVLGILLLAIGIDTQSEAIGNVFADIGKAGEHREPAPTPVATPFEQAASEPVLTLPEPSAPHGPAATNNAMWFTTDDYPVAALQKELQGAVAIELRIDTGGRATDCAVVQSSGVSILDETTCRLARARATFYPARDPDGVAIPSVWHRRVIWRLPE